MANNKAVSAFSRRPTSGAMGGSEKQITNLNNLLKEI